MEEEPRFPLWVPCVLLFLATVVGGCLALMLTGID